MKTMPVPSGGYKPPSGRVAGGSATTAATTAKPKKGVIPPQFLKKGAKKK